MVSAPPSHLSVPRVPLPVAPLSDELAAATAVTATGLTAATEGTTAAVVLARAAVVGHCPLPCSGAITVPADWPRAPSASKCAARLQTNPFAVRSIVLFVCVYVCVRACLSLTRLVVACGRHGLRCQSLAKRGWLVRRLRLVPAQCRGAQPVGVAGVQSGKQHRRAHASAVPTAHALTHTTDAAAVATAERAVSAVGAASAR